MNVTADVVHTSRTLCPWTGYDADASTVTDWPHYGSDELEAVRHSLVTGRVNYWNGEQGQAFEKEFAAYCGAAHAVAVANGSVALELALYALGIGVGDDVVVTPRTFIASASSIVLRGARPVFADVNPVSQNITRETVAQVLTHNTRAIIAVHLGGWPCEMDGLRELADIHELRIIEDCAQAHGAEYRGRRVGSLGDAAAFSFCTDKIMTTGGEGGMVLFQDEAAFQRARSYKDHGKDWDAIDNAEHPPGYRWLHASFGTNWRLTEMQSAIGRVQLGKLDNWLVRRRVIAEQFDTAWQRHGALRLTEPPSHVRHAYYKHYVFVRPERLKVGWSRDAIVEALNERGVPALQGICPEVYRERAFIDADFQPPRRLPVARELGETSLMLPVHPMLEDSEVARYCEGIDAVMREAGK